MVNKDNSKHEPIKREIKSTLQKCYDCWHFKKPLPFLGAYRCKYGQIPVMLRKKEGFECYCWTFLDIRGKEAPALRALYRNIRRIKKRNQ